MLKQLMKQRRSVATKLETKGLLKSLPIVRAARLGAFGTAAAVWVPRWNRSHHSLQPSAAC